MGQRYEKMQQLEAENQFTHLNLEQPAAASAEPAEGTGLAISAEWLAYIGLALLALWLRVAGLGDIQLTDLEARQALAAWHTVEDDAPGAFSAASSPLAYNAQLLAFSLLGADEGAARIGPALAGFAFVLTPLLFRRILGRTRTFIWALLLALLTLPVASARMADGTAFMMFFAAVAIWLIRRYWYSRRNRDAICSIVAVSFMVLLSSPAGIPLLAVLLAAGWLAVWRTALSAPQRLELPGDDILQLAVKRLREFPCASVLLVPLLVLLPVATLFMLNRAGLSAVGQLLESAISGIRHSAGSDGLPLGFAALVSYEPLLILFATGGAWLLWKKGDVTYIDRFAAAWAVVGALGLLLYPGARPADAMWVVLPLTLLASYGITQLMVNRRMVVLWATDDEIDGETPPNGELYSTRYWWAKWAISAGLLLCLFILSLQFMQVARLMLDLPSGTGWADMLGELSEAAHFRLAQGLGLLLLTGVITLIVFALVANFWGLGTCLQGIGLGFFWLLLLSGMGGGWQLARTGAAMPNGLWRQSAIAEDAYLLRDTLFELARRDSAGFPLLSVHIVTDAGGIVDDDGIVAWLLRDFPNARFLSSAAMAAGEQIVLMADDQELSRSASASSCGGNGRSPSLASGISPPGGRWNGCAKAACAKKPSFSGCARMSTMASRPSDAPNFKDAATKLCRIESVQ